MALSLGDAALAFAGGAAKSYNKEVEKQKDHERRMIERAKELQENAKLNLINSNYSAALKRDHENRVYNQKLEAMGGVDSDAAKYWFAKNELGWSDKQIYSAYKGGQLPSVGRRQTGEVGIPNYEEILRGGYSGSDTYLTKLSDNYIKNMKPELDNVQAPVRVVAREGSSLFDALAPETSSMWESTVDAKTGNVTWVNRETLEVRRSAGNLSPEQDTKPDQSESSKLFINKDTNEIIQPTLNKSGEYFFNGKKLDMSEYSVYQKPEDAASQKESSSLFTHRDSGAVVKLTFSSEGNYYYDGKPVSVADYDPITDDTATEQALKVAGKVETLKARRVQLGNLEAGLANYKKVVTEGTTGGTGFVIDVGSALAGTITGIGELLGVDPTTPAEREKLLADAGVDINDFIGSDQTALRGLVAQDAKQLVYTLAGILKDDADLGRTSVADVQRAANMIKDLGATDRGIGALKSLESTIAIKKAGNAQAIYQSGGVAPSDRMAAGKTLIDLTIASEPGDWDKLKKNIKVNLKTGEIFIVYPDGERSLDQVIALEGKDGSLRPTRKIYQQ